MKNKIAKNLKNFFLGFLLLFFFSQNSFANSNRSMTIFAEPNMALALTKIARLYSQKSNVIVSVNIASSSELISNIDSGEPADVFISAHPSWIETLRQKGLVDVYNIGYIAGDQLVLVTSKSNPQLPTELLKKPSLEEALKILDENKATLILDNIDNSSGKFSNEFFMKTGLSNLKIFNKLIEDKSPILKNLKDNDEQYALLLLSQVKNQKNLEILASKSDSKIFYQALAIAGDNMEVAREFLKFLKSAAAQSILKESGFVPTNE
jgi:molybdate transport system substrate-binding protein